MCLQFVLRSGRRAGLTVGLVSRMGPAAGSPLVSLKSPPLCPPSPSIRMMALSQVVVPAKQGLRTLSTHMGHCHPSSCQGSHSYPQVREQATEAGVGSHVWDTKPGQQRR